MTYKELLSENNLIKKLSFVQFFGYFGAWFSNVAILTLLVKFNASAFIISLITALFFLPAVILSPINGVIIDKMNIKKLMTLTLFIEIITTIMFLTIDSLDDVWFLAILLFIRMGSASVFFSAQMALFPKIISGTRLQKTNEIHSIIWSFTYASGMAVSGVVVSIWGTNIAFIIDIGFFIISLLIFSQIKFEIKIKKQTNKFFIMIKDGFLYTIKDSKIIKLILLHSSVGFTAFDTIVTLLADWEYSHMIAVPLSIGLSNASRAIALMIGPMIVSNLVNKRTLPYFFMIQGFFIVIWGYVQNNFYLSLFALFLVGFCTTTIWSYTYALLQESIKVKYLGRVLSYNEMMFMIINVTTTLFIGVFSSIIGLNFVTYILGLLFILVGLWSKKYFYQIQEKELQYER